MYIRDIAVRRDDYLASEGNVSCLKNKINVIICDQKKNKNKIAIKNVMHAIVGNDRLSLLAPI